MAGQRALWAASVLAVALGQGLGCGSETPPKDDGAAHAGGAGVAGGGGVGGSIDGANCEKPASCYRYDEATNTAMTVDVGFEPYGPCNDETVTCSTWEWLASHCGSVSFYCCHGSWLRNGALCSGDAGNAGEGGYAGASR